MHVVVRLPRSFVLTDGSHDIKSRWVSCSSGWTWLFISSSRCQQLVLPQQWRSLLTQTVVTLRIRVFFVLTQNERVELKQCCWWSAETKLNFSFISGYVTVFRCSRWLIQTMDNQITVTRDTWQLKDHETQQVIMRCINFLTTYLLLSYLLIKIFSTALDHKIIWLLHKLSRLSYQPCSQMHRQVLQR